MLNVVTLTMPTRALLPATIAGKAGKVMNVASTAAFMPRPLIPGIVKNAQSRNA